MLEHKSKRKRERLMMRVIKGGFAPADAYTAGRLRVRRFKVGDIVAIEASKPRSPGFHRLAHRIGALAAANIDDFAGMDAHQVLKRIQLEARIGCDEIAIQMRSAWDQFSASLLKFAPSLEPAMRVIGSMLPASAVVYVPTPRSLSFESMTEDEFRPIVRAFCRHIAENYWHSLTPEKVEQMAECFVGEE